MVPTQNFMLHADRAKLPLRVISGDEYDMGDYSTGRWAWVTGNLRRLDVPVMVKGRQGLFNLPHEVESIIMRQLNSNQINR